MRTDPRAARPRTRTLGASALLLAALGVLAGPAMPAFAHNTVIGETPDAESTVTTQPGTVALETSDALLDAEGATAMDVIGPDGRHYANACPSVDRAVASVPAELGPAGEYTVEWRVVSADGHPITGSFAFTWAPSDGEWLVEGAEQAVCARGAAGSADASSDAEPDAAASGGPGDLLWVVGGAVVVALAGVAAFLLMRRRPAADDRDAADSDAADTAADSAAAEADDGPASDR
ncbi:copper resistance protein CopC [Agromyces sp. NPDC056523]|uniref:copper resistance CopC family protein n=1 Tax=Agromyces sp. NPDC056523 TaxID=3345850 RepID=UPI00366D7970